MPVGPGWVLVATGLFLIGFGIFGMLRGEISGRGQALTRDERPVAFILTVSTALLGGALLVYVAFTEKPKISRFDGAQRENATSAERQSRVRYGS